MSFWEVAAPILGAAIGGVATGTPQGAMAGGSLGGGIGSMLGNKDRQEEANAQNRLLAGEARGWQEYMSSTAHQREVKDLKAAGLNPILSSSRSGASTPGTSPATMNAFRAENELGKGVSSAVELYGMKKDLEMAESQKALNASAVMLNQKTEQTQTATAQKLNQETIEKARKNDIDKGTTDAMKQTAKEQAQADLKNAKINNKMAEFDAIQTRSKNTFDTLNSAKDLVNPWKNLMPPKSIPLGGHEKREKWKGRDERDAENRAKQFQDAENLFKKR